jgi:L-fuconolactonase
MRKIDSHQHFWIYNSVKDRWITADMSIIQRDFLPDDVYPLMRLNNISGCIAVQADQSEQETMFLLDLASKHDFIKGIVGWVDLRADNIEDRLKFFSSYPAIKGFRHIVEAEADLGFLQESKFKRGALLLNKYGYSYDLLVRTAHLSSAIQLVKELPAQRFVIDHMGKPDIRLCEITIWSKQLASISEYPNVYCKISGFSTEANWLEWCAEDITPYLNVVFKLFGPNRVMFGSDWPVCLLAGGYQKTVQVLEDYLKHFSITDQHKFWRDNAREFYQLSD